MTSKNSKLIHGIAPLGSKTRWGEIASVRTIEGERYYFMVDKDHGVAMMPAFIVEREFK